MLDRLKAIKDLLLSKLDLLLAQQEALHHRAEVLLENQSSLLEGNIYLVRGMQQQGVVLRELRQGTGPAVVATAAFAYPEVGLARHLYAWLPSRRVLYVGSPDSVAPLELLAAGFFVEAVSTQPTATWPKTLATQARFSELAGLTGLSGAPPELLYFDTPDALIPAGSGNSPVVALAFAGTGLLTWIEKMRAAGYGWYLVLYSTADQPETAFFCNYPHAPVGIRGQVFFFAEHRLFAAAYDWCAAILPVTRFR